MSKWIAEFELEDGDTMPEYMDLNYKGAHLGFHCKPFNNAYCISRQDVDKLKSGIMEWINSGNRGNADYFIVDKIEELVKGFNPPSVQPKEEWIPIKWHNITEEEREREGYPKEWLTILDCQMPNDDEEVLVTVKGKNGNLYVETDTCYFDGTCYSSDNGYDWIDDVIAWMPLPEPYKVERSEKE